MGTDLYPQIPVDLMPIVTSPSLRSSPFLTVSRLGVDSATHRSCAGFVKTAMFALLMVVVFGIIEDLEEGED